MKRGKEQEPSVISEKTKVDLLYTTLTPEQADSYFQQAKNVLNNAKDHPYRNLAGRLRGQLSRDRMHEVIDTFGILMPLSIQECVRSGKTSEATPENIGVLLGNVGTFLAGFKNTGVTLLSPDQIIPTMTAMIRGETLPHSK